MNQACDEHMHEANHLCACFFIGVKHCAASEAVIAARKHSCKLNVSPIRTNCSELCVRSYLPALKRCVFFSQRP